MEKVKRRFGDRRDGMLIRDLDPMHFIVPLIYPNRCDNEAYISERIDLSKLNAYVKAKNEQETDFPYTIFHVLVAALLKTLTLRPKMNRFIQNKNVYQLIDRYIKINSELQASKGYQIKWNDTANEPTNKIHTYFPHTPLHPIPKINGNDVL